MRDQKHRHVPWAVVGQILPAGVSFGGFVVMVGRLDPATVGTFAMATLLVSFLASFGDLGLGVTLMRREQLSRRLTFTALRWTIAVGCVLTVVALGTGAGLSAAGWRGLGGFVLLMSGRLLLDGFNYIPTSIAQRHLRFRFLALRDLAAATAGAAAGVAWAFGPNAEWCLAVAALVQVATAATFSPFAIRGLGGVEDVKISALLPFAAQITAQQVFKYFTQSLDGILVGALLGSHALGQYRVAQRLGIETSAMVRIGIGSLVLPELVRAPREEIAATIIRVQRALLAAVGPLAVLVGSTSEPMVDVFLGGQWAEAGNLLRLMCVVAILQIFLLTVGETMKFSGKGKLLLFWTVGVTVAVALALAVGALLAGVVGVAVAYILTYVALVPIGLSVQHQLIGLGVRACLQATGRILVALTATALVALGIQAFVALSAPQELMLAWGAAGLTYLGCMVVLDRPTLRYLMGRASRIEVQHIRAGVDER